MKSAFKKEDKNGKNNLSNYYIVYGDLSIYKDKRMQRYN